MPIAPNRNWVYEQINCILDSEQLDQDVRDRLREKLINLLRTDRKLNNDFIQHILGNFIAQLTRLSDEARRKIEQWLS